MARRVLICVLSAATLLLAGCGNKEDNTNNADTEGIWVDAGPLDYHVQGSRQLSPGVVPDDRYLAGVPASYGPPEKDETWFAVFLRIENKTDAEAPTAEEFEIEDTEGQVYKPLPLDTKVNAFAYEPTTLRPKEVVPAPDSSQQLSSSAGSLLLFKLPLTGYQNRPLEFFIHAPDGEGEAKLALDV